jgi:hypothetical protein
VDNYSSDFVPFATSSGSDGLNVYRSHFTASGIAGDNGNATVANSQNGGNTLGGGPEAGGDVGGAIQGPFPGNWSYPTVTSGYADSVGKAKVIKTTYLNGKKKETADADIYEVTYVSGSNFQPNATWEGQTIVLTVTVDGTPTNESFTIIGGETSLKATNGNTYTFDVPVPTATALYVSTNPGVQKGTKTKKGYPGVPYSVSVTNEESGLVFAPGVLNEHQ